ncbi:MAG TPA: MFS transporter [Elusimicrobiales bacterium]|nr:MFS transporter [Elusimicrobiales bacterium]
MNFFKDMKAGLTRNVTFLGVVSGLTDISSEMLYPIVPIFLTSVLGAPMQVVGLIEGVAEATASFVKILGGRLSDKTGRRKPFVIAGYSLSAISKPVLALAATWHFVLFSRFIDRVGKGLRTSARDALIAGSVDKAHWGKAFGFHRSMDTLGAALGPLAALAMLQYMGPERPDYKFIFMAAFIPALLGVGVLVWFVREAPGPAAAPGEAAPAREPMTGDFKTFVMLYAIFALGNSSDVFLIMKARQLGFTVTSVILAYTGYNLVYALLASPAGWLSDRLGKIKSMVFGFAVFTAVYLGFALAGEPWMIWPLFALYGFYGAFNEGIAKAVISHLSAGNNRASAMGYFQGTTGFLTLAASVMAGLLWDKVSPAAPFLAGAACALLSGAALTVWARGRRLAF